MSKRPSREGVISQELPLTLDDLAEIRNGEQNHEKVLWTYRLYESPQLEKYVNAVAASVAEVSTRPHLPYHVILLDDEEVNIFGGPGGYIYITRGLCNFVESESELAGVLAHEVAHLANYEYSQIPHQEKLKSVYSTLLRGSEFAKDSIGSYGTAMNYGLKGIGKAAPYISRHFSTDQEILADERAVDYMIQAGYDPKGYKNFMERLATVKMEDVSKFVLLLNTHPPFADRRQILNSRIDTMDLDHQSIEFKQDMLSEVRQMTVNSPDSIVFQPQFGTPQVPVELQQLDRDKQEKITPDRKRWGWF